MYINKRVHKVCIYVCISVFSVCAYNVHTCVHLYTYIAYIMCAHVYNVYVYVMFVCMYI